MYRREAGIGKTADDRNSKTFNRGHGERQIYGLRVRYAAANLRFRSLTNTMHERTLLGMLTPSSNTVLEPVTTAMLAALPEVSAHFSRFPVTEIALSDRALKQFDRTAILAAAQLLM